MLSGVVHTKGESPQDVLSVYCVVVISNERKKSEMEVSTDWWVAFEHWKLSSVEVIFVDYQTSELQYNY